MSVRENNSHSVLRAKFRCNSIKVYENQREFTLNPVYGNNGDANSQWSKWTPSGELKMLVTNENAFDTLEVGKEYFLDFIPAEAEPGVDKQIEAVSEKAAA